MKDSAGLQLSGPAGRQLTGAEAWRERDPNVRAAEQYIPVADLHRMKDPCSHLTGRGRQAMADRRLDIDGAAHLVLAPDVRLLHPEEQVLEAMLDGWATQQHSRLLAPATIEPRLKTVRRFVRFTGTYPWQWTSADIEEWTSALLSGRRPAAHSTLRAYQLAVAAFLDYLTDARYGWTGECEQRFGTHPVQICHEYNTATHANGYEGRPGNRPLTKQELQTLFDHADAQVDRARRVGRKGWLRAFRDAALFKVCYAFGLRRREVTMLDVADFAPNPAAPEFGRYGVLSVRYGKATKGSPPRRRSVLTVMGWSAEVVAEWVEQVRPRYDPGRDQALWPTERGGRIAVRTLNEQFAAYRDALGLPAELSPHCLRHAYVTHLIEDGFDPLFVQQQVGHAWGSTTALYTGVSSDYKNRVLRRALDAAFTADFHDRGSSMDGEGVGR
jgi:site-specific recombinase XerD